MIVRGLVGDEQAERQVAEVAHGRVTAAAPDLVYAEVTNALARYVRTGQLTTETAREALRYLAGLPLRVTSCEELANDAFQLATGKGLSGYDAMYLALAEASGATLVTADRKLAAAASRAELLE